MAKQMDFVTDDGVDHSASYWVPGEVSLYILAQSGAIVFYGFHDSASRVGGKIPIYKKAYAVNPDNFATYFSPAVMAHSTPIAQAYALAMATLDTNGASFFNGALDV